MIDRVLIKTEKCPTCPRCDKPCGYEQRLFLGIMYTGSGCEVYDVKFDAETVKEFIDEYFIFTENATWGWFYIKENKYKYDYGGVLFDEIPKELQIAKIKSIKLYWHGDFGGFIFTLEEEEK